MLHPNTAPIDTDLFIQKGTTKAYEVQFKKNGTAIDITGWTVFFTVKEHMSDTDAHAIIKKTLTTHSDPTAGITLIRLETEDTDITPNSYYYDLVVQDNSSPVNRAVILRGRLTIEKTTTRREAL
jgi:hypothetical protein